MLVNLPAQSLQDIAFPVFVPQILQGNVSLAIPCLCVGELDSDMS